MRYKDENNPLKLYAVAGTQTVLLAFHLSKAKAKGEFLGFDIERKDKNGTLIKLNGSKLFDSLANDPTITDPRIKFKSLIQSFFWKDYLADPGQKYSYTVKAMFGTARDHIAKYTSTINVWTEKLNKGKHSVFFNYGVTGSQGYARNAEFGNQAISTLSDSLKEKALDYLSRDLYRDGLLEFISQARTQKHSLYCCFYEIEYHGILDKLHEAQGKIKNLEIIYSGQSGQNKDIKDPTQRKGNITSLKEAGLFDNIAHIRTKVSQPHNKFMILCYNDKPIQVWTGSTNLTMSGIFGQSNTGHWVKSVSIAKKYKQYWDALKVNPSRSASSVVSEDIQATEDLRALSNGTYVFFSPRNRPTPSGTDPQQLLNYVDLIDSAKELVCMIFPFNFDDIFKTVFNQDKDYLRLLLFEKTSQAKSARAERNWDKDLLITGGAVLQEDVKNFIEEVTAKKTVKGGVLFVHNKFLIIDPLGKNPCVLSGSANFSRSSILNNDENMLFIKGDERVADIYLTEFNRLFEHFWPRYLKKIIPKSQQKGFGKPLDETYEWHKKYTENSESYQSKRGKMFINMQGAKQG